MPEVHTHTASYDSLKLKGFSPEEAVVHEFAACPRVEDFVEGQFAVVAFLGREGPGLEDPHRKIRVHSTDVVPVWTVALRETAEEGEEEEEKITELEQNHSH